MQVLDPDQIIQGYVLVLALPISEHSAGLDTLISEESSAHGDTSVAVMALPFCIDIFKARKVPGIIRLARVGARLALLTIYRFIAPTASSLRSQLELAQTH